MSQRAARIMAAGRGTCMKSPTPKVLHRIGGRTMLDRAIDAVQAAGCARVVVVCGTHSPAVAEHVRKRLGEAAVAIRHRPAAGQSPTPCCRRRQPWPGSTAT